MPQRSNWVASGRCPPERRKLNYDVSTSGFVVEGRSIDSTTTHEVVRFEYA